MGYILGLASASAAFTTALGLFTGIVPEPTPAAPAALLPRALAAAAADAVPARAVRTIPIDGRYGIVVLTIPR